MTDFDLTPAAAPPEGYVLPGVAAAALGISVVTLGKWRATNKWGEPLALSTTTRHGPTWMYHLERVKDWAARNRGDGVGGTRQGAGRPRKRAKGRRDEETNRAEPEPPSPIEAARLEARREADVKAQQAEEAQRRDLTDPLAIVRRAGRTDLARVEVQNQKDLISAGRGALELQEKLGQLLDRDEVREAWAGLVDRLVKALELLPIGIAGAVMAEAGLAPEAGPTVRKAVDGVVRAMRVRLLDDMRAEPAAGGAGAARAA